MERFLAHKRRVTSLKVSPDVRDQLVPRPWPQNRGDFWKMPAILGEDQTIQMYDTLLGTNISHLGKGKIIFKSALKWDMLVFWRVVLRDFPCNDALLGLVI